MPRSDKFSLYIVITVISVYVLVAANALIFPWAVYPFESVGQEAKAIIALEDDALMWQFTGYSDHVVKFKPTGLEVYAYSSYSGTCLFTPSVSDSYFNLKERFFMFWSTKRLIKKLRVEYRAKPSVLTPYFKGVSVTP